MSLSIKSRPKLIDLYAGKAWMLETSLIKERVNPDINQYWKRILAEWRSDSQWSPTIKVFSKTQF